MKRLTFINPLKATFIASALLGCGPAAIADDDWEFMVAPLFLWGMSIDGESAIDGNALPLDLSFNDDVLDNLNAAFSLHFEARKNDLLLFAEYQHVNLDPSFDASIGPATISASIDFEVNMAEFGAGYTLSNDDLTRWEIIGGLRWTEHDLDVDLDAPPPLPSRIQGGDDWYQGFAGGRVTTQLGEKWQLLARADYGYGGSNNDALHFSALVDYRFKNWGSAFFGYRYMEVNYEDNGYLYDAKQQGPQIGVAIHW
jgi:hypothetical protein